MSDAHAISRDLISPEATDAFAQWLAPRLGRGDVLLLEGEIGAGKTHLARALIQARLAAADRLEDVPSPTYTLVQTYDDGVVPIWHADLYRISHPDEVLELGLQDAFTDALCLVEWPDRLGADMPTDALTLRLTPGATALARHLTLRAQATRWAPLLQAAASEAAFATDHAHAR